MVTLFHRALGASQFRNSALELIICQPKLLVQLWKEEESENWLYNYFLLIILGLGGNT